MPDMWDFLNCCFGIYHHVYNEVVELDMQHNFSLSDMTTVHSLLTKKENFMDAKPWKDQLPMHMKQQAMETFFKGKKAALANSMYKVLGNPNIPRNCQKSKSPCRNQFDNC